MEPLRLYLRYVSASARSQLQYRASVLMYALGQVLGKSSSTVTRCASLTTGPVAGVRR